MPAVSSVHIDRALTNLSIAYMNDTFVADMVFPPLPVQKDSDKYFVYDREAFLRGSGFDALGKLKSLRRPRTEAVEDEYTLSNNPYFCEEYARRQLVTDKEQVMADAPLQPRMDATNVVTERLKIDNESAVAKVACTTTNYPTAGKVTLTTGGSGTSWASYTSTSSLPLSNIRDGKIQVRKSILREPNKALYTVDSAQTLADHPDIKELVKYVHADALSSSGLPKVLRGLETIEGSAQQATSAEGAATLTTGNIWADENSTAVCLIFYTAPNDGPRTVHLGRTFDAKDATTGEVGITIRRYRDEPKKGEWVEGSMTRDWRHVALDGSSKALAGYLISATTA